MSDFIEYFNFSFQTAFSLSLTELEIIELITKKINNKLTLKLILLIFFETKGIDYYWIREMT